MSHNRRVTDPFGVAADAEMPTLALAIDPEEVERRFKRGLPRCATEQGRIALKSIQVLRYKPGRRCVIAYDIRVERPDAPREKAILIGKVRARRFGNEGYRLLDALWNAGFHRESSDHICVPEPIGVIPEFRMWLQRKVPGTSASELLLKPESVEVSRRVAEGLCKLHRAGVPTERTHDMADELRILHERLPLVAQTRPQLAPRIERVLQACDRLGASVPARKTCGIHRDFYPAQVVGHAPRLYLLDFDLYCQGDPALDAGNYIGHVTEISLRVRGDPAALSETEQALEERFVELANGPATRQAVRAYATLTLVRHIYLSTLFPERAHLTEQLLAYCEERLLR